MSSLKASPISQSMEVLPVRAVGNLTRYYLNPYATTTTRNSVQLFFDVTPPKFETKAACGTSPSLFTGGWVHTRERPT